MTKVKSKKKGHKHELTFLNTFADTVGFLEEVVVIALATAVQKVFALSRCLVIIPTWKGAFTRSYDRSSSTRIYRTTDKDTHKIS